MCVCVCVKGTSYLLRLHLPAGEVLHTVHEAILSQLVVCSQELLELFNTHQVILFRSTGNISQSSKKGCTCFIWSDSVA